MISNAKYLLCIFMNINENINIGIPRPFFFEFYLILKVLINILKTKKFDYLYVLSYDYRTLSYKLFDTNFSSLKLLVTEILAILLAYLLPLAVIFLLHLMFS